MFNASLWGRVAAARSGAGSSSRSARRRRRTQLAERLTNIVLGPVTETVTVAPTRRSTLSSAQAIEGERSASSATAWTVARFRRDSEGATTVRNELSLPADAAVLMLVAAHRPGKRHDRFVSLVERLHASGTEVYGVMVGGGPMLTHTRALADASPVSAWLRVTGPVIDMPATYSAADVRGASIGRHRDLPALLPRGPEPVKYRSWPWTLAGCGRR